MRATRTFAFAGMTPGWLYRYRGTRSGLPSARSSRGLTIAGKPWTSCRCTYSGMVMRRNVLRLHLRLPHCRGLWERGAWLRFHLPNLPKETRQRIPMKNEDGPAFLHLLNQTEQGLPHLRIRLWNGMLAAVVRGRHLPSLHLRNRRLETQAHLQNPALIARRRPPATMAALGRHLQHLRLPNQKVTA